MRNELHCTLENYSNGSRVLLCYKNNLFVRGKNKLTKKVRKKNSDLRVCCNYTHVSTFNRLHMLL